MLLAMLTDGFQADASIIAIATKSKTGVRVWTTWESGSEQAMLESFLDYFLKAPEKIITGFNILKFEIPLLLLKAKTHEKFPELFKKINSANVEDLFVILTFKNKGLIKSMDAYLKSYRLPNVPQHRETMIAFEKKEYEKVSHHLEAKISALDQLFEKVWSETHAGNVL